MENLTLSSNASDESGVLDEFCGDKFWDLNVTWNTDYPDFTSCFKKTVLVWIPCLFLWVFSPLEFYYVIISKNRNIPWTILNITKFFITAVLIIVAIVDLAHFINVSSSDDVYPADYLAPVLRMLSFAYTAVLLLLNMRKGLRSSGLLFIFWFLFCICEAVQYRYHIIYATENADHGTSFSFVLFMIYYPLLVVMLFLNCFSDAAPQFLYYPPEKNPCPEKGASFLSRITFSWYDTLSWKGFRKPLVTDDLWSMNAEDMSKEVVPHFLKFWEKSVKKSAQTKESKASFKKTSGRVDFESPKLKKKQQTSILPAIFKAFGPTFFFGSCLKVINDLLTFVNPLLLSALIGFVQSKEWMWKGYLYAGLMFLTSVSQTIILAQYFHRMFLVGLRIRTALIASIYRKALVMSNAARRESTVGEIVNLMSVDAQRFMDLTTYLNMIWSAPLQIILALYFLWNTLGPSVLAGLAVMIILIPVNGFIASRVKSLQIRQMKNKDQRVKLMNEILSGIKVLKLYAWEPSFEQQVLNIRNREIHTLKQAAYLNAGTAFIWSCAPFLVSLVTFATYVLVSEENVLDSRKAFVSLSLFNILRFPLSMLPMMISSLVQASVSVKRMNKFMNSEELDVDSVSHDKSDENPIVVENGTFTWNPEENAVLKNINLTVKKGGLLAVVGSVGSGKSSLISAILGEMEKVSGRINTKGSIAYVPQQAWIQNATLRNNITFGKEFDGSNYKRIIHACALKPDFDMLPAGDQTEIGEKGINLSGGQKQRVSLARAVYNDADMYFLDDPLSAVDSHVGKHIFENVIGPQGVLNKKTRILVTHGITYLQEVDQIIVMKDGEISEHGTYKELLQKKGAFAEFLMHHIQEVEEDEGIAEEGLDEIKQQLEHTMGSEEFKRQFSTQKSRISESDSSDSRQRSPTGSLSRKKSIDSSSSGSMQQLTNDNEAKKNIGEKLIEAEKAETGRVKWRVYSHYLKSIGVFLSTATILLNMIFQGFSIGSNFWLSAWSNDNSTTDSSRRDMYLGVYGALGVGQAVTCVIAALMINIGILNAAALMHNSMTENVLKCPMSFFDTTPVGRVLNRFSKDVNVLDNSMSHLIRSCISSFFRVLATLFVISYSTPIFISVIVPIGIVYFFVQRFYVATSRQLKRLESVSRSPIYSHFGESITGAPTIRAYCVQKRFIQENENTVDFNQVCYYPSIVANRWLAVRLEMVGNLIILFSSLFAVIGRDTIDAGIVGLSVSYALQITQTLNWLVRMTSDVETNIVAVERIKEYGETEQEAPWELPSSTPPPEWPSEGRVEFKNFQVRYRKGLDLVLKGIDCNVNGGEKVGIVGRTGAGKSSLTLALFRIIESAGGNILIDDLDIAKMGLHALRGRLTIIPQDPVLFSGTLRMNLDPFEKHSDADIWRALEHAHLSSFVKSLSAGLQHEVSEGGENLSVGQRQLICLARALLRKTKVLILDEATAAVDLETDELIQTTIRTEFKECTILTIAHRLNTIMDSDRVIVLDKGRIVEFDSPAKLLESRTSVFYGMAKDAGLV
ncbi:multidrug resistance-associated protein 1 isoform X3 [Ischnura elegans]|uniref:multidrug resistance-associated protein 1 isoform X3 n=1 Tax=Ischnura elegans TaxID=197161 RepID=UPI001ED8BC1D|nr:multidrug resistance-associated protein 1 isoform X3 [Ischnura elegans]